MLKRTQSQQRSALLSIGDKISLVEKLCKDAQLSIARKHKQLINRNHLIRNKYKGCRRALRRAHLVSMNDMLPDELNYYKSANRYVLRRNEFQQKETVERTIKREISLRDLNKVKRVRRVHSFGSFSIVKV